MRHMWEEGGGYMCVPSPLSIFPISHYNIICILDCQSWKEDKGLGCARNMDPHTKVDGVGSERTDNFITSMETGFLKWKTIQENLPRGLNLCHVMIFSFLGEEKANRVYAFS